MHIIRLRGPWKYEIVQRFAIENHTPSPAEPAGDIPLPCDWRTVLPEDFAGVVRFRRWFNSPTGITSEHQILLVIDHVDGHAIARLDDHHLFSIEPGQFPASADIKHCLASRNELIVDVTWPLQSADHVAATPRGLTGLVWLAIFEPGEPAELPPLPHSPANAPPKHPVDDSESEN